MIHSQHQQNVIIKDVRINGKKSRSYETNNIFVCSILVLIVIVFPCGRAKE